MSFLKELDFSIEKKGLKAPLPGSPQPPAPSDPDSVEALWHPGARPDGNGAKLTPNGKLHVEPAVFRCFYHLPDVIPPKIGT